jgi:hypothetical protein
MVDRINQKQTEITQDMADLRRAIVGLHSGSSVHIDTTAQQQAQSSNLPINGVHQPRSGTTLPEVNQQISTDATRYASLLQNGTAQ